MSIYQGPRNDKLTEDQLPRQQPFLRVVAFGGGTGLANLLQGLKRYVVAAESILASGIYISDLSAIVAVSDDGGSSGRLREEYNVLPPGDICNCIVALCEDGALLSRIFQHRFHVGEELKGHSLGSLFLAAMTAMTGDFAEAVTQSAIILNSRGYIYPATTSDVQLEATLSGGTRVLGETAITACTGRIIEVNLLPSDVRPMPQTLKAIADADLITVGPGSLFTSLVPHLLVPGISEAIRASHAVTVFICNLMTEENETLELTAADHLEILQRHAQMPLFHYMMVNQAPLSIEMTAKYAGKGITQVSFDVDAIQQLGVTPVVGNYIDDEQGIVQHAADRLARDLLQVSAISLPKGTGVRSAVPVAPTSSLDRPTMRPLGT